MVRTLAFNPNLQIASQSALDCSEAAGEVNSICKVCISKIYLMEFYEWQLTHVVDTEVIQSLGNFNLLLGIKEGIGELFTFSQSTFDDLET